MLYSATQHAREWIAAEINRRLMFHYIDKWRAGDKSIRRLLEDNELWFILVANPDGYQYTFTNERLWRKNLRDNNGNGEIDDRRRRRPEPQLPGPLEVRQRGLVVDLLERDLPRHRAPPRRPRRRR